MHTRPWIIQFPARTRAELRKSLDAILEQTELPDDKNKRILIKPNFNNDLNALTGNSTDLRLLWDLCTLLQKRGFGNLVVADGPNTGVFLANIDVLERFGCRRMCDQLGVECIDLNYSKGRRFEANGGADACVANEVLEADYVINVPKIKTHADTVFSCCVKNWMGINVGEAKWGLHVDLFNNLINNISFRPPDLCIVDGLIAMEADGPGDGSPVWLGTVIVGNDSFYLDCAIAEKAGINPEKIPYLCEYAKEHKNDYTESAKKLDLPVLQPASERSLLTRIATSGSLGWLRAIARPLTKLPGTMQLLYHCGIVQDVYDASEASDHIHVASDISDEFMNQWCPGKWETIRSTSQVQNDTLDVFSSEHCVRCYYCYWADVRGKVKADINSRYLKRHIKRYIERVKKMVASINN